MTLSLVTLKKKDSSFGLGSLRCDRCFLKEKGKSDRVFIKFESAIADPVIWVNAHNPVITSLSVTAITFSDKVRSPSKLLESRLDCINRNRDHAMPLRDRHQPCNWLESINRGTHATTLWRNYS